MTLVNIDSIIKLTKLYFIFSIHIQKGLQRIYLI